MKKPFFVSLVFILIAASGFAAVREARIIIPPPEVILAEKNAVIAAERLFDMRYLGSATLYNEALPNLPDAQFHKRIYARALAHLGYWEESAQNLVIASADTMIRNAVERDLERVRALQSGKVSLGQADGRWERLQVNFAQNKGVGAITVLSNGTLAVAYPSEGAVGFWAPSGRQEGIVRNLGTPAALVADGDIVWVADMAGNRLHRVNSGGILATIPLTGVHGVRSIDRGPDGSLWIADYGNGRAIRLSREGAFITQSGLTLIEGPTALLRTGDDLLITEAQKDRVLRYDRNGRLLQSYSHKLLKAPAGLARTGTPGIDGDFLVQGGNGLVFWGRDSEASLFGPLPGFDQTLITSHFGLAADDAGNLWWGDGRSLRVARRIPMDMPVHLVEVIKAQAYAADGAGKVVVTASVMSKDGKPIETLSERDFRLLKEDTRLLPIRVENLSRSLAGRRITIVSESSDALLAHKDAIGRAMEYFFESLTLSDMTSIVDVTDTYRLVRDFTVSPELIRRALFQKRPSAATIDVSPSEGLNYAIQILAPTDYARAVLWITGGEGIDPEKALLLERMGIINQVPVFILHIGEENAGTLQMLSEKTNGKYFRLYGTPSLANLGTEMAKIKSGRYRIIANIDLPQPNMRGNWTNLTLEAYYLTEGTYDKVGYFSF